MITLCNIIIITKKFVCLFYFTPYKMSDKRAKNDKKEQSKKEQKNPEETFMVEIDNGDRVSAKNQKIT